MSLQDLPSIGTATGTRVDSFWVISEIRPSGPDGVEATIDLIFRPLRTYFEEEAATSTTRVQYISGKPL